MNAQTPDEFDPNKATPVEEQLDLPGMMNARVQEEEEKEEAARKKRAAIPYEFLTLEQLEQEIKATYSTEADKIYLDATVLLHTLDARIGEKMIIPKVAAGAKQNNANLIVELLDMTSVETTANGHIFRNKWNGGHLDASEKGIFFRAEKEGLFKKKAFTQDDARHIALLAMHNQDLLPPNEIKITGKAHERAMIFAEVQKLNELLPENARFVIDAKQARKFAVNAQTTAPEEAQPPVSAGDEKSERYKTFEDMIAQNAKEALDPKRHVGGYEVEEGVSSMVYGMDLPEGETLKTVHYVVEGNDAFRVLAVEDEPHFASYLLSEHDRSVATAFRGDFDAAGAVETAPRSQNDPDFIGPREFVGPRAPRGWTPPTGP